MKSLKNVFEDSQNLYDNLLVPGQVSAFAIYTPLLYLYRLLLLNASFLRWHFETQHPGDTPVIRLNQNDIYVIFIPWLVRLYVEIIHEL